MLFLAQSVEACVPEEEIAHHHTALTAGGLSRTPNLRP